MLNIRPVSFIKNNYTYQKNKNNSEFNAPLIKPLESDTVSFSGARNLNRGLLEAFDNIKVCEEVHDDAEVPENHLKKILNNEFSDLIVSKYNQNGLIGPIKTRIKSPESIREKAASKFEEAIIKHDTKNFVDLNTPEGIKAIVQDIVGAKITVNQLDIDKNAEIIKRLIKLVNSKALKINNIEVISPSEKQDISPYFDDADLEELKNAVNKNRINPIKIQKTPSYSGYSALHLDIDLEDKNMALKNAGYIGEIQIMGVDVAYFKDLEDYCYKVKQGKDLKSNHPAYRPFSEHLKKYLNDSDEGKKMNKKFEEYTYRAYILQRKKDPKGPNYNKTHLPSLQECQMENILPKELDFNHLIKIKNHCDKLYQLTK